MKIGFLALIGCMIGVTAFLFALRAGHTTLEDAAQLGLDHFGADLTAASVPDGDLALDHCDAELLDLPMNSHLIVTCQRALDQGREAIGTYTFYESDGSLLDTSFQIFAPQEAL